MWKAWVTDYYQKGFYSNEEMKTFVKTGWITATDYQEITGIEYS